MKRGANFGDLGLLNKFPRLGIPQLPKVLEGIVDADGGLNLVKLDQVKDNITFKDLFLLLPNMNPLLEVLIKTKSCDLFMYFWEKFYDEFSAQDFFFNFPEPLICSLARPCADYRPFYAVWDRFQNEIDMSEIYEISVRYGDFLPSLMRRFRGGSKKEFEQNILSKIIGDFRIKPLLKNNYEDVPLADLIVGVKRLFPERYQELWEMVSSDLSLNNLPVLLHDDYILQSLDDPKVVEWVENKLKKDLTREMKDLDKMLSLLTRLRNQKKYPHLFLSAFEMLSTHLSLTKLSSIFVGLEFNDDFPTLLDCIMDDDESNVLATILEKIHLVIPEEYWLNFLSDNNDARDIATRPILYLADWAVSHNQRPLFLQIWDQVKHKLPIEVLFEQFDNPQCDKYLSMLSRCSPEALTEFLAIKPGKIVDPDNDPLIPLEHIEARNKFFTALEALTEVTQEKLTEFYQLAREFEGQGYVNAYFDIANCLQYLGYISGHYDVARHLESIGEMERALEIYKQVSPKSPKYNLTNIQSAENHFALALVSEDKAQKAEHFKQCLEFVQKIQEPAIKEEMTKRVAGSYIQKRQDVRIKIDEMPSDLFTAFKLSKNLRKENKKLKNLLLQQFVEADYTADTLDLTLWNEIKADLTIDHLLATIEGGPNAGFTLLKLIAEMTVWSHLKPFMYIWIKFQDQLTAKDVSQILFSLATGAYFSESKALWLVWDKFGKDFTIAELYELSEQEEEDFDGKTLLWLLALEAHCSGNQAFRQSVVDKFTSDLKEEYLQDEADNSYDGISTLWLLTCSAANYPDKFQILWDKILKDMPEAEFNALMKNEYRVLGTDLNLLNNLESHELAFNLTNEKMNGIANKPRMKPR